MAQTTKPTDSPAGPPTLADLQAAFDGLAIRGHNLQTALADPLLARIVTARARQLHLRAWQATQGQAVHRLVRRCHPTTGQWTTQRVVDHWIDPTTTPAATPRLI